MYVCGQKLIGQNTRQTITDNVFNSFGIDSSFNFEERYIGSILDILRQTLMKLLIFLDSNNQETEFLLGTEGMITGWKYLTNFRDDSGIYLGAIGISDFYYEKQGSYAPNSQFLFGTAYQFL
jgi:hypothetical protein